MMSTYVRNARRCFAVLIFGLLLSSCGGGGGQTPAGSAQPGGGADGDVGGGRAPAPGEMRWVDEFLGQTLNRAKWDWRGSTVSLDPAASGSDTGALRLSINVTDDLPRVRSEPIPIWTDRMVVIERRFRVQYRQEPFPGYEGDVPFRSSLKLFFDEDAVPPDDTVGVGVRYAHYNYEDEANCPTDGFYLYGDRESALCPAGNNSEIHEATWGTWLHEILAYHPGTGRLAWWLDGVKAGEIHVAPRAEAELGLRIEMQCAGWWTGHTYDTDWIRVTQSRFEYELPGRLYAPMGGNITEVTEDRGGYAGHRGTDIQSASAPDDREYHGLSADASWWNHGYFPPTHKDWPNQRMWPAEEVWSGARVYAAASGRAYAKVSDSAGRMVYVDHPDGSRTKYFHLYAVLIEDRPGGVEVTPRDVLGIEGNTGLVEGETGLHLHFEMRDAADAALPTPWFGGVVELGSLIDDPEGLWRIGR